MNILPNAEAVQPAAVAVVETTKKVNTMEFVDFKGGNEYCLEINGLDGKPIVQLIFNQVNTWNTPRQQGEPASSPDKSYIIVQVNRITEIHPDGEQEVEKLKKYLMGMNKFNYTYMGKNLKLDYQAASVKDNC